MGLKGEENLTIEAPSCPYKLHTLYLYPTPKNSLFFTVRAGLPQEAGARPHRKFLGIPHQVGEVEL